MKNIILQILYLCVFLAKGDIEKAFGGSKCREEVEGEDCGDIQGNEECSKDGRKIWEEVLDVKRDEQGCPLNPMLFNVVIADIERELEKGGREMVGRKKLRVLGYADDIVILAKEEEGMKWLIRRLEGYFE
ncbi:reverse transcriptase [Lasius niger]|uniref:Reverse transcriptase n=1 Tax=Lasius niger TaxID=67767 RepID=A0A0J7K284_LASNI|nr:reverse transcriptase [Lasius niger]